MSGRPTKRTWIAFLVWLAVAAAGFTGDILFPGLLPLASGLSAFRVAGIAASVLAGGRLLALLTTRILLLREKPRVEGSMVGRVLGLAAWIAVILLVAWGVGRLSSFGTLFSLFGGMILGWSLQAPVSGFAAWILVSLKRPYRPGDRIQFPGLELTGDLLDVGVMYTTLDQVGGAIGSEEAVGRTVLIPNAMLFNEVAINYSMGQERPFMLDEVVVRITYDSIWDTAEKILLGAAREITADIIEETGVQPYIRSDLYDYGVYMQLRYQSRVRERAEIAYRIQRKIFEEIQKDPTVDIAIPFIYSYRAGRDMKEVDAAVERPVAAVQAGAPAVVGAVQNIQDIPIASIRTAPVQAETQELEQLMKSIAVHGLLEPVVVMKSPVVGDGEAAADRTGPAYELLTGHVRVEACRRLGWATIPAIIRPWRGDMGSLPHGRGGGRA
jgi:small-conductance mechanosensitive channel